MQNLQQMLVLPECYFCVIVQAEAVSKLCVLVGTAVGGYAGWELGELLGLGFGWDFVLSGAGSLLGVYAGWKLAKKLEE